MRRLIAVLGAVTLAGFLTAAPAEAGAPVASGWDRWGVYGTNWEVYGQGNYGYPYSGYARAYGYSYGGYDLGSCRGPAATPIVPAPGVVAPAPLPVK